MGLMALRNTFRPQRNLWRILLLTLAAITSVMLGLFVMHSLNPGHNVSERPVTVSEPTWKHDVQIAHGMAELAGGKGCSGVCAPDHSLTAASCAVALLAPIVLGGTALSVPDPRVCSLFRTVGPQSLRQ